MKLVIIESPFSGDTERNIAYARAAVRDSVMRGESPIASHLLFTQEGILDNNIPEERGRGIMAGLAWRRVCDFAAFYIDNGWSHGVIEARHLYKREEIPFVERRLIVTTRVLQP